MKVRLAVLTTIVLAFPLPANAQDATTGAIEGVVRDSVEDMPAYGATVKAVGKNGVAELVIVDDNGWYKITGLQPGLYTVTFYYGTESLVEKNIRVGITKTTPLYAEMGGEVIVTYGKPPPIDPNKTAKGKTYDRPTIEHSFSFGTDFTNLIGQTAGTANDGIGIAVSGSSSLENQYVVDGVVTTGLKYGQSGSGVINDFIEEIEVITGGYNAEYGRATGGIINVVTRTGGNDVAGSVFAYYTPGFLVAGSERTPSQATSIDSRTDLDYDLDVGVELGGPIIKDHAWYWVGFAPQLSSTTTTRTTRRRTDCRVTMPDGSLSVAADARCDSMDRADWVSDGAEDIDPATGFYIYEDLDSSKLHSGSQAYAMIGKINAAITPEQQGQISLQVTPELSGGQRSAGYVDQQRLETKSVTSDLAAKWTSKFNDNKTEIEAVVGLHRASYQFGSKGGDRDDQALQVLYFGNLGTWSRLGGESRATGDGCADNTGGDPYEFITNCPDEGVGYAIGGPGSLADDLEQRISARFGVTQRVANALGDHEIKAGVDIEDNRIDNARMYSGNQFLENLLDRSQIRSTHWVKLMPDGEGTQVCRDDERDEVRSCEFLTADDPASRVEGETINWSAYLRDSWRVRPNITINAGLRYEEQRLRYARDLRDSTDPLTGRDLGTNAMVLQNMWAPRLGMLYDWTREGRSKLFGHWGRFYESIPMDINDRSFGGEVSHQRLWDAGTMCGAGVDGIGGPDGNNCGATDPAGSDETLIGSGVLVAPGIKPQYLDEILLGADYELMEDLTLSLSFQNRRLGRVIEDVSVDGAATYVIANPGEWSSEAEADLEAQIASASDDAERNRLQNELAQYQAIRSFDTPRRDYSALQIELQRRFSKSLYLQASYTYSRTEGNFPGLVSYDNGQVDPNISSQYDLIELLANRNGPLPQDRPHYVKLDGYYTFDLKEAGDATFGARVRALSGTPVDVLGKHYLYGVGESFLLPRGSLQRNEFDYGLDLHADYGRALSHGMRVSVFVDVSNVLNTQGTFSVDEDYTYLSNANPIVGGTYEDLIFAKEQGTTGAETSTPIKRNPNFGHTASRYAPLSARFGARLTF